MNSFIFYILNMQEINKNKINIIIINLKFCIESLNFFCTNYIAFINSIIFYLK